MFEVGFVMPVHIDIPLRKTTMPDSHLSWKMLILVLILHSKFFLFLQNMLAKRTVIFEQKAQLLLHNVQNTSRESTILRKMQ